MQSLIIIAILGVATAGAAGMHPGIMPACAIVATAGLLTANPGRERQNRWVWLAGSLILGWVLVTSAPLPPSVTSWLTPARQEYFTRADGALSKLDALQNLAVVSSAPRAAAGGFEIAPKTGAPPESQPLAPAGGHCLSLNQHGTLRFFLLLAGCWGMFWMSAALGAVARRRLLKALVIGGSVVATVGITGRNLGWITQILPWQLMDEFGHTGSIWPFVNRNHFAAFAAMLAPAALCLTLSPRLDMGGRQNGVPAQQSWKHPVAAFAERLLYFASFVILVGAVFLSQSRGGAISLLIALLLTIMYWLRGRQTGGSTVATILGIGVLLGVVFLPSAPFQQRMESLQADRIMKEGEGRIGIWRECLDAWKEFPVLGAGMEGVRVLHPIHRTSPSLDEVGYAHNEYVQLLADGGLVGAGLFAIFCVLYLHAFAAYRFAPKPYLPAPLEDNAEDEPRVRPLRAAVMGAGAAVLFHSFFDFPCRIPLNALLLSVLLGLGLFRRKTHAAAASRWRYAATAVSVALLCAVAAVAAAIGDRSRQYDYSPFLQRASVRTLAAAASRTPSYWRTWNELGMRAYDIATGRTKIETAFEPDPESGRPWFLRLLPPPAESVTAAAPKSERRKAASAPEAKRRDGWDEVAESLRLPGSGPADSGRAPATPPPPGSAKIWMDFSIECFRMSARCNPCNYRVWETLGNAEGAAGNLEQAQAAFDNMVRLAPYTRQAAEKAMREFALRASQQP